MTTTVHLLYRDGCNYKTGDDVVFDGDATPALIERFLAARDEDLYIVPEQVGLEHPATHNDIFAGRYPDEEDDHGYVEVEADYITPGGIVTDHRTFEQFVEACEQVAYRDGWDPTVQIAAAGGWQDPVHCAVLRGGSDE